MADCAARGNAPVSQGDRLCCEDSQFGVCRVGASARCLYGGILDLEWEDRTQLSNVVRATRIEVELNRGWLLVCLLESSDFPICFVALVHEALHMVSVSLAGEPDQTESCTYASRPLRRIEFHRKKFLHVRSHPLCPGVDSCRRDRRSRSVSGGNSAVFQDADIGFCCVLRSRSSWTAVDVYSADDACTENRPSGIRLVCATIRRKLRSQMGAYCISTRRIAWGR